ncbi:uncharacterized protein ARMOST_19405 [Armillaria ostoyae]|uniref:F-box domain-containing protein n=1 Tax=Armillaria ostoyae TaxID=47428 RepID=A0A284S4I1_ARMOS|nr:uncharacterized protein ARMOST_19405 [Armillaria ostoyae]
MPRDKSHAIHFLNELSKGRQLARFIRALYFHTLPANSELNVKGLRGKLIVAAVPQMETLEKLHWRTMGQAVLQPKIMNQIIHSLSDSSHIHLVSILSSGIKQNIPCAPFHGLTHLTIRGSGSLDYAPAIITNSPNLFRLEIIMDHFSRVSTSLFPVLSLFGAFPNGTYSSVQQVILSGQYFNLEPSTVPALIPHLQNLSEFHVSVGFDVPDEFWIALRDTGVFLHRSLVMD